jgi:murein DD-endopeptidase MepM/ murein hydrolase activator NlpD
VNGTAKPAFLVKIIPPNGYDVYRVAFTYRHLAALGVLTVLVLVAALGIHTYQLQVAEAQVRALVELTAQQRSQLRTIDRQADALAGQLRSVQHENAEIRRLIGGGHGKQHAMTAPRQAGMRHADFAQVQARLRRLAEDSARTRSDAAHLQRLALRVLNVRRLARIARERLIAAIPSLNPVDGTIASPYGYRTNPWPEFHKGVDLAADFGTPVHAAASGTVVSAGWDAGGFGIKVDIDHGNGYHTWYAHLSRVAVTPGERVTKGEPIAFVGSTGESTGPHLHYQVMHDGNPIDPEPFLNGVPSNVLATLPDPSGV